MHAQHALLLDGLDGNEVHLGARGGFADRCRVVGVVLAALALHPVRGHQVSGNDAHVQPQGDEPAGPVVALELASMATMQPGSNWAHHRRNLSRGNARPVTRWPAASTA